MKVINVLTLSEMCEAALDGEPVFIIRAQDKVSQGILEDYYQKAFDAGARNLGRVRDARRCFAEWQEAHPDRVKVPD